MLLDATDTQFRQFLKLLQFSANSEQGTQPFLYVSNGYMWRRDHHRICVYALPSSPQVNYQYDWSEVEGLFSDPASIELEAGGILHIKPVSGEGDSWISCDTIHTSKAPLRLFDDTMPFDTSFSLSSALLSKQLSVFQTKLRKSGTNPESASLILDLSARTLFLSTHPTERVDCALENVNGDFTSKAIHYPFLAFKDLLANASKFDPFISFYVHSPYVTVLRLSSHVSAALMHKKESG
jgi:hypothetical protein